MPEPFKNLINADLVRACGVHLQRHWRGFDRRDFERQALAGLDALEMKARAMQIADALEATLPDDFDRAAITPASTGCSCRSTAASSPKPFSPCWPDSGP